MRREICRSSYEQFNVSFRVNFVLVALVFRSHLQSKHPEAYAAYFVSKEGDGSIDSQVFDQAVADRMFSRFVGQSTVSFHQASSPELESFCAYLNPDYKHPSRNTLVTSIRQEAERASRLLKNLLREASIVSSFCPYVCLSLISDPHFDRHLDSEEL